MLWCQRWRTAVVMLSDLVRRTVVDRAGRRATLVDIGVDLTESDRPPVILLVVRAGKDQRIVPIEQVVEFGDPIRVNDLAEAEPCAEDLPAERDLLRRDVLDMLVLD